MPNSKAGGISPGRRAMSLLATGALLLSGCVSPTAGPNGKYATPIGNAPVTANPTPYSSALVCLGEYARQRGLKAPRIAVGRIADYTGKEEADGSGRKLTQGASLMAISALAKSGAPLVERYDTSVSELELKYANNKLISDDPNAKSARPPAPVRKLVRGPEYEKLSVYFNLDNGAGKIRGVYMQGNEALRPTFRRWLEPFRDLGAETLTSSNTGSTDHIPFDAIGLNGLEFLQDPLEYSTRSHHSNEDVFDRVQADDLKQAAVIIAAFVYEAAMADEKLPRKPLVENPPTRGRPPFD